MRRRPARTWPWLPFFVAPLRPLRWARRKLVGRRLGVAFLQAQGARKIRPCSRLEDDETQGSESWGSNVRGANALQRLARWVPIATHLPFTKIPKARAFPRSASTRVRHVLPRCGALVGKRAHTCRGNASRSWVAPLRERVPNALIPPSSLGKNRARVLRRLRLLQTPITILANSSLPRSNQRHSRHACKHALQSVKRLTRISLALFARGIVFADSVTSASRRLIPESNS